MTSYRGLSCVWALTAVRLEAEAQPGKDPAAKLKLAQQALDDDADLPDDVYLGLKYALKIAVQANERRLAAFRGGRGVADGDLPHALTVADIATELDIDPKLVVRRIAVAREYFFDGLSDRQIRRLRPSEQRYCADCGDPLPLNAPRQRRYCAKCSTPAAYTRRSRARVKT